MGNIGSFFGLLNNNKTPDGPYGSLANGFWAKVLLTVYIPSSFSKDQASRIERGVRKWEEVLRDPKINILLTFTRDPSAPNDIAFILSDTKPGGKWGSTSAMGTEIGMPWNYAHALITLWKGIPSGDLEKTAAHETGHALGLTRHSEGGLMDPDILSGTIHAHDKATLIESYTRDDRPRADYMRG